MTPAVRAARHFIHTALAQVPRRAHGDLAGLWLVNAESRYRRGDYEPGLSGALCRLIRPGFTCADVGAHHGYFSLLLAKAVGSEGRVVAFEASPANARVLRRNLALNRLTGRVDVVEAVVADGSRTTYPLWPARSGGSTEWTLSEEFAARADAVPVVREPRVVSGTTLDEALRGRPPNLLKIDVEGAEALVLAGAVGILREVRPLIVLEFHRELGWPAIERLQEAGYVFEEVDGTPVELREPSDVPYHVVALPRADT